MKVRPLCVVAGSGLLLVGCGVVHSVYRGVTAPVRMVAQGMATPTPLPSDVVHPGHPVAGKASPTPTRRIVDRSHAPTKTGAKPAPTATVTVASTKKGAAATTTKSTTTTKKAATTKVAQPAPTAVASARPPQQQFPVGRPVPEKPGYVYSPSDPSKYVDVSGYAPGSKVKDPYSGRIFVVP